jgi:hypothetical protein
MSEPKEIPQLPVIAPRPRLRALMGSREPSYQRHRERRATPRAGLEVEFEERMGDSRFIRVTTDVSTFGLAARGGPGYPPGTRLRLRLYLPDEVEKPLDLEGLVVGLFHTGGGVRISFRNPAIDAVKRLYRFLTAQRQQQR